MKIKMPLKARITVEYLINLAENAELPQQDIRSIFDTIYAILEAEDVDDTTYDYIHQQITELIN